MVCEFFTAVSSSLGLFELDFNELYLPDQRLRLFSYTDGDTFYWETAQDFLGETIGQCFQKVIFRGVRDFEDFGQNFAVVDGLIQGVGDGSRLEVTPDRDVRFARLREAPLARCDPYPWTELYAREVNSIMPQFCRHRVPGSPTRGV